MFNVGDFWRVINLWEEWLIFAEGESNFVQDLSRRTETIKLRCKSVSKQFRDLCPVSKNTSIPCVRRSAGCCRPPERADPFFGFLDRSMSTSSEGSAGEGGTDLSQEHLLSSW